MSALSFTRDSVVRNLHSFHHKNESSKKSRAFIQNTNAVIGEKAVILAVIQVIKIANKINK
jgi:hypothetical protein